MNRVYLVKTGIRTYLGVIAGNIIQSLKRKFLSFFIIVFTALFAVSCGGSAGGDDENDNADKREQFVKIVPLESREVSRTVEYTATLQAYEELHLAPASPGRIENIFVEIGSPVSRGNTLVQMDRTQLHQAEVQLKTLETDLKRLDTLRKTGSVPKQQYDQLKSQYDIAKSNVEFLRDNTQLKAPFSGIVSGKYFESGEMFSGAPNTPAGKAAVVSLVQIDKLKAVVSVSEKFFPLISKGMEATIVSDIYPDEVFTGRIFRIHPVIDPMSRSFNVEIMINNSKDLLRPGMFSRISFDIDRVDAMLLPSIAVLKMQGSNIRYLFVEENGIAKRVEVTAGRRYDDMIEVFSDELNPDDKIIVSGQARLLDGSVVNVVKN